MLLNIILGALAVMFAGQQHAIANSTFVQPSKKEIERTVSVIKTDQRCPKSVQFISCGLKDLPKHPIVPPNSTTQLLTVLRDRVARRVHEISTDLKSGAVVEWKLVDNVQPMVASDEYDSAEVIVRHHKGWRQAILRRGLDSNDLAIDIWASGVPLSSSRARTVRALTYVKTHRKSNLYDRPVEGLVCMVNLDAKRVTEFHDVDFAPVAKPSQDFNDAYKTSKQIKLAPFTISQNPNAAIILKGSDVEWANWKLSVVLSPREGLVLHNVQIEDGKKLRKIAHRISLSEMVVPYGDTSRYWYWRNAFDAGEYGVGNLTTPLTLGEDLPTNARTINASLVLASGKVKEVRNAIGIYERDAGVLWKHADPFTGENRVRRGRELVITHTAVVGNYDYSISYILSLDGSITCDVSLSGILLPKAVRDTSYNIESNAGQMFGALVAPNIVAPSHQHYFSFRIDLDVDGDSNRVSEVDQWSPSGEENLFFNAIKMDDYEFLYEKEAVSDVSLQHARMWKVTSADARNALNGNTAYALIPHGNSVPYLRPENFVTKRAEFIKHHLWVTRYRDDELYAAGNYPNQSEGGEGLPVYVKNNESLRNKDIVLWYTMGLTHQPRPEDWPVMPSAHIGFSLKPVGFFDRNPTLGLPPKRR
ncbi:MAG: primary-amine oxidase [Ignavibacteria bacterium]|nr:primary-amine oxidase [Ignavibacteria bacterium]